MRKFTLILLVAVFLLAFALLTVESRAAEPIQEIAKTVKTALLVEEITTHNRLETQQLASRQTDVNYETNLTTAVYIAVEPVQMAQIVQRIEQAGAAVFTVEDDLARNFTYEMTARHKTKVFSGETRVEIITAVVQLKLPIQAAPAIQNERIQIE